MRKNKTNRMNKIIASTAAAIMMMTMASSLAASADTVDIDAVTSMSTQASLSARDPVDDYVQQTSIKLGMIALEEYVPGGKLIAPLLGDLLSACGIVPKEASLDDINENITEMRAELNSRLNDLEKKLDKSTTDILNKITNKTYIYGLGTELDKLHTSIHGIGNQIDSFNGDTTLTPEERAVEIAALIGNNSEWNTDGKLVFRIKNIGNTLSGRPLADMNGRNMYKVVYDECTSGVMFSGEAYDKAASYVDRVMYEYFYSYTVMSQCFEAANTVAQFTPEQVDALSATVKHKYFNTVSQRSVVDKEVRTVSDQVFNADREDSVVSAYAVFNYKKNNERNVLLLDGKNIVISKNVKETAIKFGSTDNSETAKTRYNQAKNAISDTLKSSAIKGSDIKKIWLYAYDKYPDMSFDEYLAYVGIDTSNFKGSMTKFFSKSDDVSVGEDYYDGGRHYTVGIDTFRHIFSQNEEMTRANEAMKAMRNNDIERARELFKGSGLCRKISHDLVKKTKCAGATMGVAATYDVYSLKEYDDPIILTFEEGTLAATPRTAGEMFI